MFFTEFLEADVIIPFELLAGMATSLPQGVVIGRIWPSFGCPTAQTPHGWKAFFTRIRPNSVIKPFKQPEEKAT